MNEISVAKKSCTGVYFKLKVIVVQRDAVLEFFKPKVIAFAESSENRGWKGLWNKK